MAIMRRTAKTRPCKSGSTLLCQRAWLEPLMMGMVSMTPKSETAMRGIEGCNPAVTTNIPDIAENPSTPTMRRRGPPQALITSVPTNMPTPTMENR